MTKRLAIGISANVDNARAIGRHAHEAGHEAEDAMLLSELADVVEGFLDKFRMKAAIDPDAELSRDIALVPGYLSRPNAKRLKVK